MILDHPYDVARAALLEVGRGDLCQRYNRQYHKSSESSFNVGILDGRDYFFKNLPGHYMLHLGYLTFIQNIPLEDVALIERAMYIGLESFKVKYQCESCEARFKYLGIVHDASKFKMM